MQGDAIGVVGDIAGLEHFVHYASFRDLEFKEAVLVKA